MNRREAAKNETRTLILKAARKLFAEKGPDLCTMRDIAGEAGVSPASVVVHFKNKTALLEAALFEDIERNIRRAVSTLPEQASLLERLMHISGVMYRFYGSDRELYRVLIRNTAFEPIAESPHLAEQMSRYMKFFAGMIEQEKTLGSVRADTDARAAASALFYLYLSVLMEFLRTREMTVESALAWLERMACQHLNGILKPGKNA